MALSVTIPVELIRQALTGRNDKKVTLPVDGAADAATGIPVGGSTGQQLGKLSGADVDVGWQAPDRIPAGGTTGQQLTKQSNADHDLGWAAAGSGGISLPIAESDVTNLVADLAAKAPLANPVLTGDPKAPTPAPGDNDVSIATTAFVANAIAAIGAGTGATYEINVLDMGAKGDMIHNASHATWAAGSNTVTVTSPSTSTPAVSANFTSAMTGRKMVIMDGAVRAVRTITFVNSTTVTLSGAAAVTGCTLGPAHWGTDDSAAIQSAWNTAGALRKALVFPAANAAGTCTGFYLLCTGLVTNNLVVDCINKGGRRSGMTSSGVIDSDGGAAFVNGILLNGIMVDHSYTISTSKGPQMIEMAFLDPMLTKKDATLHKLKYNVRWKNDNCSYGGGGTQLYLGSGTKDISWGQHIDADHKFPGTYGIRLYNFEDADNGAMAIEIKGGQMNLNGGCKGIYHQGSQYYRIGNMKYDVDGVGTVAVLVDSGSAGGASANNGVFYNLFCEKTSSSCDATSGFIEVTGATSTLDIRDCSMGGGGISVPQGGDGFGHGFGIYLHGADSSHKVEGVRIHGGSLTNGDYNLRFGANTRGCVAEHIRLLKDGVSVLAQFDSDATCQANRIHNALVADNAEQDIANLINIGVLSQDCFVQGVQGRTTSVRAPWFSSAIGASIGGEGDLAWRSDLGRFQVKIGAAWVDASTVM